MNKNDKINIAYLIDRIPSPNGGTEGQLLMLLKGLDKRKFSPHLICLRGSEWLDNNPLEIPVMILGVGRLLSFNALKKLFAFRKFCRQNNVDIVQTFFMDSNIFGTIAAKVAGCKINIASRRNAGYKNTRWHLLILRFLRTWTSYYLANSKAAARMAVENERVPQDKIKVIYNGLELEKFRDISFDMRNRQRSQWGIAEDEILVGSVANLRNIKNLDFLIKYAAILCKEFPQLKFVVVGEGPDREKLQKLIDNLAISSRFSLVGRFSDVLPCLAAFDIAVLCSKSESFSNSIIEYMAAGLPVVASNVGGIGEAIEHEKTGLLYEVTDEKEFRDHIRRLINNCEFAQKLGKNARNEAFSKYSVEKMITEYENLYEDFMCRTLL